MLSFLFEVPPCMAVRNPMHCFVALAGYRLQWVRVHIGTSLHAPSHNAQVARPDPVQCAEGLVRFLSSAASESPLSTLVAEVCRVWK